MKSKSFPQSLELRLFIARSGQYNRLKQVDMVSKLIVAVGSTRKPKLAAVREAMDGMADLLRAGTAVEIVDMEVESGVNHTPRNREESMRGARQRAEWLQQIARQE